MVEQAIIDLHHPGIDADRAPKAVFVDFGDSSVNLKLLTWVEVLKQGAVESDIKTCIYDTLNSHQIEIPFPQVEVKMK